jgi:hypothetical protein
VSDGLVLTQDSAETYVKTFLDNMFNEVRKVVEYEQAFIQQNGLASPNIDYFKLKRFLETAVRNLRAIDNNILTGLVYKLYKDVMDLYEFYGTMVSKTAVPQVIFGRDFLKSLKPYRDMSERIDELKAIKNGYELKMRSLESAMKALEFNMNTEKRQEHKQLKIKYAEATHYFAEARDEIPLLYNKMEDIELAFKEVFLSMFGEYKEYYLGELKNATNAKFYYLDKLLWYKAERSNEIRRFFKDSGIKGGYDTKTFIEYYLRNIDTRKTFDKGWHGYLREILTTLE